MVQQNSSPRWPWLVAVGAVITIAGLVLMAPYAQTLGAKHTVNKKEMKYKYSVNGLMFAFSKEKAAAVLKDWKRSYNDKKQNGISLVKKVLWPGDFVFPVGFGLFFFCMFMVMVAGQAGPLLEWGMRLRWLPVMGALFDFVENSLHLHMLSHAQQGTFGDVPAWLPVFSSVMTTIKYSCVSILTPLAGLLFLVVYWRARPVKNWKVYGFVVFAILSFSTSLGFFLHTLLTSLKA